MKRNFWLTLMNSDATYWVAVMCVTGAFSISCVVYVEDCVGWRLPSSCGSVVKTLAAQARDPEFDSMIWFDLVPTGFFINFLYFDSCIIEHTFNTVCKKDFSYLHRHCRVYMLANRARQSSVWSYLFAVNPGPIHYVLQNSSTLSLQICHFSHQVEELREHPASHG